MLKTLIFITIEIIISCIENYYLDYQIKLINKEISLFQMAKHLTGIMN